MLDATLTDRAKSLLTASKRSDVPPFMVMDVMAAAARIEASGGHVIHMEVGQPAAPAPKAAIAAARAALESGRIEYTYCSPFDPEGFVAPTGSSGAFILASLPMFGPGDRGAGPFPGYPPYRH